MSISFWIDNLSDSIGGDMMAFKVSSDVRSSTLTCKDVTKKILE